MTLLCFPRFEYGFANLYSLKPSGNENLESYGHYLIYIMGFALEIKQQQQKAYCDTRGASICPPVRWLSIPPG